jgi:hypothetical protein
MCRPEETWQVFKYPPGRFRREPDVKSEYSGPEWQAIRRRVLARDDNICQIQDRSVGGRRRASTTSSPCLRAVPGWTRKIFRVLAQRATSASATARSPLALVANPSPSTGSGVASTSSHCCGVATSSRGPSGGTDPRNRPAGYRQTGAAAAGGQADGATMRAGLQLGAKVKVCVLGRIGVVADGSEVVLGATARPRSWLTCLSMPARSSRRLA